MLRRLYDWVMRLAEHPHAMWCLAAISFIESSFFPIPPDVLLIAMVLANRDKAWTIALVCTVSSALGGCFGYGIGFFFYETLGYRIVTFYHLQEQFLAVQDWFRDFGVWAVLVAGVTPIPYKLITISSGVVQMDFVVFTAMSVFARGLRFFLVTALLWWCGPPIRRFIETRLELTLIASTVLLVGGFAVVRYL